MNLNISLSGQGMPLVLFHGWGFDQRVWLPLVEKIQHKFRVYLVDLPGFGQSDWMLWEAFKLQLLTALPERFAVLGWSMGGLYAMRLAVEEPSRVTHLLSVASSPQFVKETSWPGIDSTVLQGFYENFLKNPEKTRLEFIRLQSGNNEEDEVIAAADYVGLKQGLEVLQNWDLRLSLHNLSIPACFIFGRLDTIVPARTLLSLQTDYPSFHCHLMKKSAHMPFRSQSQEFLSLLEQFLL